MIAGELRAKLLRQLRGQAGLRGDAPNHTPAHQAPLAWRAPEGWRARLRCPWAAAGPGRTSRRRAERSSRRGQLAGGRALRRPEHQRRNTPHRHNKTAQPHRGRAAQTIRERVSAGSRRCPDHRDRFPDGRSKCRAWMRCPWRCLPCAGLRRRRWRSGWSIRQHLRRWFRRSRPGSGSEPAVRRIPGCRCR